MAQHDQVIDDDIGLPVRLDINAALAAIFSSSAGATEPDVIVPGQLWFDTSGGTGVVKLRNAANTAWKVLSFGAFDGSVVYTRPEMEARFQPLAITYTMSQSDTLFNQLSYTKTELDAKFNPLLDPAFAPSAAPTKKVHLTFDGIAAGTDRAIRVPDKAGLTVGGWELIIDEEFAGVTSRNYTGLGAFSVLHIEAELWPVSANAIFDMYFSADNGATWITDAAYWNIFMYGNGTGPPQGGGVQTNTSIRLTHGNPQIPGAACLRNLVDMKLWGFNKPQWVRGSSMSCWQNTVGTAYFYLFETAVGRKTTAINNALRIDAAGVLFNGHMTMHGLRG